MRSPFGQRLDRALFNVDEFNPAERDICEREEPFSLLLQ